MSPPFDVRWRPEVSNALRRGIAEELGFVRGEQVTRDPRRRTRSYRLRHPTPDRVRAILRHPVEDTAHIDMELLRIVE